jgi:hypothetical protein
MFSFLGVALTMLVQSQPTLSSPTKTVESEAMVNAIAAIITGDEAEIRRRVSNALAYDPTFDHFRSLREPDRLLLEGALRAVRSCEVRGLFRSDETIPSYTVNWVCRYQSSGKDRSAYDGAAAILRWRDGRPTLMNFNFQGPWPRPPRSN